VASAAVTARSSNKRHNTSRTTPVLSRVPGLRHRLPQPAAEPIGTTVSAIFFSAVAVVSVVILRFACRGASHVRHSGPGSGSLLHIRVAGRGLLTRPFHSLFPNCNASLSQLQAVGELPD
jgi:high-affinity nickel permease